MTFITACVSVAGQTCTVPAQAPNTRSTRVDYRNQVTTDYYALSLSWSPAFCAQSGGAARTRFQCADNTFGFVVHGLWAQSAAARGNRDHPRFCRTPEVLPSSLTRGYMCIIPDAQLIQDEWNKHGACAFPNARTYLDRVQALWNALQKPDISSLPRITAAQKIRDAWVRANRAISLKPEHISLSVRSGNVFDEALICYDKEFRLTACLQRGTPDSVEVRVIPKQR